MSATLGNGNITFGNGSVQSVSQLNNYAWINQSWSMGYNGSQDYYLSVAAGPQGIIHLFVDAPWTCLNDNGCQIHYLNVYSSSDNSNWTQIWSAYQYSVGYSQRWSPGNFSLTYPTSISAGQTYYFKFTRTSGTVNTQNWLTAMAYGV